MARYEAVSVPPFTLYLHSSDLTYFNYAIPNAPPSANVGGALDGLRQVCRERQRTPRFEFIAEFAPELPAALAAHGFVEESRNPLLLCHAADWRAASPVADLMIVELSAASPTPLLRAQLETGARGFNPAAPPVRAEDIAGLLTDIAGGARPFLALLGETPVAVGTLARAAAGMVELAGIATLVRYRRRGIATALTAYLARAAFDAGVDIVVLSAADEHASRIYQRVGFRVVATMCAYTG